jgi:hypothetical protein
MSIEEEIGSKNIGIKKYIPTHSIIVETIPICKNSLSDFISKPLTLL